MPPLVVVKWGAAAGIWIDLGFTTKCLVLYCHAAHEMPVSYTHLTLPTMAVV